MNVSVIIPAWNAAETVAETLESLLAQTFPDWEAIVVNDGSTDGTAAIAANFAERDTRIHPVSQPHLGTSAARNKGVSLARFDWLLFLDSDDWLLPLHLERLTDALATDPSLDAVYCGWARVAPDGRLSGEQDYPQSDDLFAVLTRCCAFPIHACVVRRSLVEIVGGFDPALRVFEDWDLWQRIARTGARFGAIREVLALYRMRPGSASVDSRRFLDDGLRVIRQGHLSDPRVPDPHPSRAHGQPAEQLPGARFHLACWAAGLAVGGGEDAWPLLDALKDDRDPTLDPHDVAQSIFQATLLPSCRTPADWFDLWPSVEQRIDDFLLALEEQSQALGVARGACIALERLILEHATSPLPLTFGTTHAIRVEVTEPIPDILPPMPSERLWCVVELEGRRIGTIELPVCDGLVPGHVLADAIAAEFAWSILGRFFERTVYRDLSVEHGATGLSLHRGTVCLADGLPEDERPVWLQAHERVGWTVFLQEMWGYPDWPKGRFYNPRAPEAAVARHHADDGWLTVEVSEELPDVKVPGQELNVVPTVGGVALGVVTVAVRRNIVRTQELRAAITGASGFELCRVAVREGLLGQPLVGPTSLRDRLAAAASEAAQFPSWLAVPGSAHALACALSPGEPGVVLGRRTPDAFGTSASRWAILPAAAARELVDAAAVAGEPVVQVPQPDEQPERVVYAPDLIWRLPGSVQKPTAGASRIHLLRLLKRFRTVLHRHVLSPSDSPRRNGDVQTGFTDQLPILMYHRVAPDGSPVMTRYRVTPKVFEEQLRHLRDAGFYSVRLEDWRTAMETKKPLPGRAVLITFAHGYLDFLTYAWPLLKRYGFSAILFLVADAVGRSSFWDRAYGEEVPLLGWQEIRQLQDEGVVLGSHTASHRRLTALSLAQVVREGAGSRAILERRLGAPVRALAYPYGDVDLVVQHLIGACGYTFGLSSRPGISRFHDNLLALPRIEVTGSDGLQEFVAKIGS